jgi:2-keto-4-pentenoate hydratase
MNATDDLAAQLWRARQQGGVIPRAAADGLDGIAAAYAVQQKIAALAGKPVAGWKIGATSQAAQRLLGVDGPAAAPMFADRCLESPAAVAVFPGHNASVECEFAFRFARALPPRERAYGRDEVLDAVGWLVPAVEIVGCRFEGGFAGIGAVRLIADMVANIAWTGGRPVAEWRGLDIKAHGIKLSRNGEAAAEGVGANALGDPLTVLEWTANHLSQRGLGLNAGDVVSTGTCTGVVAVGPGDNVTADFGRLGLVEVSFSRLS